MAACTSYPAYYPSPPPVIQWLPHQQVCGNKAVQLQLSHRVLQQWPMKICRQWHHQEQRREHQSTHVAVPYIVQ